MNSSKGGDTYGYMVDMNKLAKRNNELPCVVAVRKAKKVPAKFLR